jgi:hypothetical protein
VNLSQLSDTEKEGRIVFVSRLTFHTLPGKTEMVENKLHQLAQWVGEAGGARPRIMRTHYSSPGAPDLVFEQEVEDPGTLEEQIKTVTANQAFHQWAGEVAPLLEQSSKRELFKIVNSH